ncbi:MAG TPA: hypothetical protein VKB49_23465 [Candidatus Sulfotelmatobacter sp.]|nr:hypothetical protein [Candidatus Sulfotelmatobacter sp.]
MVVQRKPLMRLGENGAAHRQRTFAFGIRTFGPLRPSAGGVECSPNGDPYDIGPAMDLGQTSLGRFYFFRFFRSAAFLLLTFAAAFDALVAISLRRSADSFLARPYTI